MTRALVAVLLLASAAACAPRVVWYGRSPDRGRELRVMEVHGAQYVEIDGRAGARHQGIGVQGIAFSSTGRVAYPVVDGDRWTLVVDGRELGGRWDGIADVAFGPDGRRVVHAAEDRGRWRIVVDGRAGPAHDAILAGSLRFADDGRVAYAASDGGRVRVVGDGRAGPAFDGVGSIDFVPGGGPVVYLARRGERAHAVVGERVGPSFNRIRGLTVSARGGVAYAARRGERWHAVVDGVIHASRADVRAVRFSPDGTRAAWISADGGRERVEVTTGAPHARHLRVDDASLRFSADGTRVVYAALTPAGWAPVLDGTILAVGFDRIRPPVLHAGGWGFVGRRGAREVVVVDGRVHAEAAWATDLVFAPGGRVAWLEGHGERMAVVVDGVAHEYPLVFEGSLLFTADGDHWACLILELDGAGLVLVIDGSRRIPFDGVELVEQLRRRARSTTDLLVPDPAVVREWVAAELARATRPGG